MLPPMATIAFCDEASCRATSGGSARGSARRSFVDRIRSRLRMFSAEMAIERRLNDAALNTAAAAMDEPYLYESGFGRALHVLLDNRGYVLRSERVQIELGFDWHAVNVDRREVVHLP